MLTVLVADDDPIVRSLLRLVLTQTLVCEVLEADNGADALALARRRHPALALLDLDMPELDGGTVCRALKADPATRDIPVLIVTGSCRGDAEPASLAAGADGFCAKPFQLHDLRARVREYVGVAS
jgi:CheY-like chemotaxis protein